MNILVVDDEKEIADVVELYLQNEQHVLKFYTGQEALECIEKTNVDLAILENVGNLVCPAEFDTGAHLDLMILSVPEGHDKPLKYPLMFSICDVVLINKIDAKSVFDFDDDAVVERIKKLNPKAEIFFISAKTGEGVDAWCDWLRKQVKAWCE